MTDLPKLGLSVGDNTEALLQDILSGLTDAQLDELEIERALETVITGSAILITAVLRLVERHLETRRQERALTLVAEGFREDPELGRILADVTKKHSEVAVAHGVAKGAWES
jgi:hypothetical protein